MLKNNDSKTYRKTVGKKTQRITPEPGSILPESIVETHTEIVHKFMNNAHRRTSKLHLTFCFFLLYQVTFFYFQI